MIAIIGCGNSNRSDDGAGAAVLRALGERSVDRARVKLLDAGTDGMAVMFASRGCDALVIIDACRSGAEPGSIFEVPGDELAKDHTPSLNLHDFRWDHALAAGQKIFGANFPRDVSVWLIEAASTDLGIELSPAVAAAVETVATKIAARLDAMTGIAA